MEKDKIGAEIVPSYCHILQVVLDNGSLDNNDCHHIISCPVAP